MQINKLFTAVLAYLAITTFSYTTAAQAESHKTKVGELTIVAPWIKATPPNARVAGGFAIIHNGGSKPERLVSFDFDLAGRNEIHEMKMDNGVMQMRPLKEGLIVKPGEDLVLKPGGYHLMIMGLKQAMKPGDRHKLSLNFEKSGTVEIDFPVLSVEDGKKLMSEQK